MHVANHVGWPKDSVGHRAGHQVACLGADSELIAPEFARVHQGGERLADVPLGRLMPVVERGVEEVDAVP
jgi:hypothetical protein